MRFVVTSLLAAAICWSAVARAEQPDQECPDAPSAQGCLKGAPAGHCSEKSLAKNWLQLAAEAVAPQQPEWQLGIQLTASKGCPEENSKCCSDKAVAESNAEASTKCCCDKAKAKTAAVAAAKCCSEKSVAGGCPEVAGKCCSQKTVASECCHDDEECCLQAAVAADCPASQCCTKERDSQVAECARDCCPSDTECCANRASGCEGAKPCCTNDKVAHLLKAAEHLQAAGMIDEAFDIQEIVQEERGELLAEKIAQMERLQGEIDELSRVAGRHVKVRLMIVEVPVDQVRKLGIDLGALGMSCEFEPSVPRTRPCSQEAHAILEALHKAKVVKLLAAPAVTMVEGRSASIVTHGTGSCANHPCQGDAAECAEHEQPDAAETRLDFRPVLLGGDLLHLEVHSPISVAVKSPDSDASKCTLERRVVAQRVLMKLGQTIAVTGPVKQRDSQCDDDEQCKDSVVQHHVQTFFLFTPELVKAKPPVSHTARPPVPHSNPQR